MELRPVPRLEWEQILRRVRLTGMIGGSGRKGSDGRETRGAVSARTFKAVALVLASYGDPSGSRIWPGDAAVAVDVECGLDIVKDVRGTLVKLGLLERVSGRRAGRPGEEYRLTLPTDLLDKLEVLTPAAHRLAAKRLRDAARGKRKATAGGSAGYPELPLPDDNNAALGGPPDHPNTSEPDLSGGSAGPSDEPFGGSAGGNLGGPPDPRTYTGPHQVNHQPHSDQDHASAVTGPRAREADEDQISSEVADPPDRWIGRARVPTPRRCDHGFPATHRPDGSPSCALCRRDAIRGGTTAMYPTIAPPGDPTDDAPLAVVLPLQRRSVS